MTGRYVLYGGGVTRAAGVQMVLEEIGLDYDLVPIDIFSGEHRTPEFLALNPAGYVPALKTLEGEVLHETAGIMLYLAERHDRKDLAPAANDPDRGRFLDQLFYQTNEIQPLMKQYFYAARYSTEPGDAPRIQAAVEVAVRERWTVLDRYLAENGPWVLGDRFSLADLHLALWAAYGFTSPNDMIDDFPAVRRIFEGVLERPLSGPLIRTVRSAMKAWFAAGEDQPHPDKKTDSN